MTDLERIARLLCEGDGFDPDMRLYPHPLPVGPRGFLVAHGEPVPAWQFYQHYVQGTLDAILAGAEPEDLKSIIDHVLSGEQIPEVIEEQLPEPEPAPDWRYKYGLKA